MEDLRLLRAPRHTEKSVRLKEEGNVITFVVTREANKGQIKEVVERFFKVKVLNVATINVRGKPKRLGRFSGRRSHWKKALITLKKGDRIEYFEGA